MSNNPDTWDNHTLMMAAGYDRWSSKASTCFFIMAYEDIFCHTDALFRVLQNKAMDIGFCFARIHDTIGVVERMREEFNIFYEQFEQRCAALGLTDGERSREMVCTVCGQELMKRPNHTSLIMESSPSHNDGIERY